MAVSISGIEKGSAAERCGIAAGDTLLRINGSNIGDVLDYRFYMAASRLRLELWDRSGKPYEKTVRKREAEDLGLLFDTYLMDKQHACQNACVFCFIDQLPKGLRKSLYFKDDDSRLNFLYGNYITLTNLLERDVARILHMHISPVNISVHTMRPELRVRMMNNPRAGEALAYIPRLAQGGTALNVQLVLCPGLNDEEELLYSLAELQKLGEALQSVAVVPVGLTKYREGLYPLRLYTPAEARRVIVQTNSFGNTSKQACGRRVFYASDEFYLLAGLPLPPYEHYEGFAQLENGVGMLTLLEQEFANAMEDTPFAPCTRRVTIATGRAAYPYILRMAERAMARYNGLYVTVLPIDNHFFGQSVTVTGLLTGGDLARSLTGLNLGEELLLSSSTLRFEKDLFLDDMPLTALSHLLQTPIRPVGNSGEALLAALLGI